MTPSHRVEGGGSCWQSGLRFLPSHQPEDCSIWLPLGRAESLNIIYFKVNIYCARKKKKKPRDQRIASPFRERRAAKAAVDVGKARSNIPPSNPSGARTYCILWLIHQPWLRHSLLLACLTVPASPQPHFNGVMAPSLLRPSLLQLYRVTHRCTTSSLS